MNESGTRRGLQPKTFASYWQQVRLYIAPHLGPVPLRNLTPGRITRWMADLAAGDGSRAPRSIGCARAVLRLALQDAVWGAACCRPTPRARRSRPGRNPKQVDAFTELP